MLHRAPETCQRAIKLPGFTGHGTLHGKYCQSGEKKNIFRLYCMADVTNTDILKLYEIHIDLICPDKIWSIIILVIILKCYDQVSLSMQQNQIFNMRSLEYC